MIDVRERCSASRTAWASDSSGAIDRREFGLGLLLATGALFGGCALLRQESEIELALAELDAALEPLIATGHEELGPLAGQLRDQVRELAREHADFNLGFDALARDRTVDDAELVDLVVRYELDRIATRNSLLETQTALLAAVPDGSRDSIYAILSENTTLLVPSRGSEG